MVAFYDPGKNTVFAQAADYPHKRGLYLVLAEPALYIPLHVDGIAETAAGAAGFVLQ